MKDEKQKKILETIPSILPVIPTMDVVVFPHMVVPLLVIDEKIINGIKQAYEGDKKILLLAARPQENGESGPIGVQDLYTVGTVATIMRIMELPDSGLKVLTQGIVRATISDYVSDPDMLKVSLNASETLPSKLPREILERRIKEIAVLIERVGDGVGLLGPDFHAILSQMQEPEQMLNFLLSHVNLKVEDTIL